VLSFNTSHDFEHYGNIVTYLRMKRLSRPPVNAATNPTLPSASAAAASRIVEARIRVRFAETDQMASSITPTTWCGWKWAAWNIAVRSASVIAIWKTGDGILLTVAEANCRYLSPARYDEEVIIRTGIARAHPRMVAFGYELVSAKQSAIWRKGTPNTSSVDAT